MAKKISKVSVERFVNKVNKKNPHSGKKIRFNWARRKGG